MRIGLVGCVKSKVPSAAPAADLYTSALFRGRRSAVERSCGRWFVLAALHGLVAPEQILEPYDLALTSVPVEGRRRWSQRVLEALDEQVGDLASHDFEVHAGTAYTDHGLVDGLRRAGASVETPVAGLSLGQQLAWYAGRDPQPARRTSDPPRPTPVRSALVGPGGGRYEPLRLHLASQVNDQVTLSFDEIGDLLAHPLPASAARHRAWWSNGGHSHSRAWLDAGYEVDAVDQIEGWVRFRKMG